jgi:hypothetical protein
VSCPSRGKREDDDEDEEEEGIRIKQAVPAPMVKTE